MATPDRYNTSPPPDRRGPRDGDPAAPGAPAVRNVAEAAPAREVLSASQSTLLTSRLEPGERVRWVGKPGVIRASLGGIQLMAGGAVWSGGVTLMGTLFPLSGSASGGDRIGVPVFFEVFVAVGIAMIVWGGSVMVAAMRSFYALTDRRAILSIAGGGSSRMWYSVHGAGFGQARLRPAGAVRFNGRADIIFRHLTPKVPGNNFSPEVRSDGFIDIRDAAEVLRMTHELGSTPVAGPHDAAGSEPPPDLNALAPAALARLNRELKEGERILWAVHGRPRILTTSNAAAALFGTIVTLFVLLVVGSTGFETKSDRNGSVLALLFGLLVVSLMIGAIVHQFVTTARSVSAVTTHRVLLLRSTLGGFELTSVAPAQIDNLRCIERPNDRGDLYLFDEQMGRGADDGARARGPMTGPPVGMRDVPDVRTAERLIRSELLTPLVATPPRPVAP